MADHNATVAQSLASVTQTASGQTTFTTASSTITINNEIPVYSFSNLEEHIVVLSETILFGMQFETSSTLTASNTVEYYSSIDASSALIIDDTPTNVEWTTTVTPRGADIGSSTKSSITVNTTGSLTVANTTETGRGLAYEDALVVSGSLTTVSATLSNVVSATLSIDNVVLPALTEQVTGTMIWTGSITDIQNTVSETASSSATLTEESIANKETFEELLSGMSISDLISFEGSIANNIVQDTAYVKNTVWAKDFEALAWTLNTETAGVTRYDNFGFISMVAHDGVLYAASPEGLFTINGDTDDGRMIEAEVRTGFLDFSSEQTKRISDIFVGYTGGQLNFDVETYDGPQEVYTYAMEEREAIAPRNNRLKVGRGLSSRYWRFAIRNVDGADFQVYDVAAEVAPSKRRL